MLKDGKYFLLLLIMLTSPITTFSMDQNSSVYRHYKSTFLKKLHGTKFIDKHGVTINYTCSMGGHPLVIYSMPIRNQRRISSKTKIYPIYVEQGFFATSLQVNNTIKSEKKSKNFLITQSTNPAIAGISFGIKEENGAKFYVNSINFVDVKTNKSQKFVSQAYAFANNSNYPIVFTNPYENYSFDWDTGLIIQQNVSQITGKINTWNQNENWSTASHAFLDFNIYPITPVKTAGSSEYQGEGFWICGGHSHSTSKKINKSSYTDPSYAIV